MTRLLAEQERTPRREATETPAEREARILALIAHYERLGLRENRQGPAKKRTPEEVERRRELDARCLAMRRAGMYYKQIAAAVGIGRTSAHDACLRAEERERRAAEREAA